MKIRFILLMLLSAFSLFADDKQRENIGSSVELMYGTLFDIQLQPGHFSWSILTGIGYIYQFNNLYSLGGWLGTETHFEPITTSLITGTMGYNRSYGLRFGVRSVFGDKVEGFAAAIDLGLPLGIGVYYKNFAAGFLYMPPSPDGFTPQALGFEIGYSFPVGIGVSILK